ncbi:TonB-dependent receptor [Niabella defluvii]|nr:TonB-dependent receptor [Niabella sp. I65]
MEEILRMLCLVVSFGAYSYNGKYLLNATLRRDGSSKFDNQNKWATSGSVGLGWVISQEAFFEEALSVINFLKLRGAWGRLANSMVYQIISSAPV